MSTDQNFKQQVPNLKNNVITLEKCCVEGCKHKPSKANFCPEHFAWFKEVLITKSGERSPDFDKKFYHFSQRKVA